MRDRLHGILGLAVALTVAAALPQPLPAQTAGKPTVTLTLRGEPMAKALRQIQKQSGWKILFVVDDVKDYTVTASLAGLTPRQAVARVLEGKPLDYTVNGRYISIARKTDTAKDAPTGPQGKPAAPKDKADRKRIAGTVTDEQG